MPHRILLIEDSKVAIAMVQMILQPEFEIRSVTNWVEASDVYYHERPRPSLLLVDLNLDPGSLRGDEIIRALRPSRHAPPMYLFSDEKEEKLLILAQTCGADGVIPKSLVPKQSAFRAKIQAILAAQPMKDGTV